MPTVRQITEGLFILLMAAGAILALYAFDLAVDDYLGAVALYGDRGWSARGGHILPMGGTAFLEFAMTAAFAVVYARRGSNLPAPFVYLWSYALLGAVFAALFSMIGRSSAAVDWRWLGPACGVLAIVIAAPGLAWNYLKSART
jgi:hypothetical protein